MVALRKPPPALADEDAFLRGPVVETAAPVALVAGSSVLRRLSIASIQRDPRAQPRERLDENTVASYHVAMSTGAVFPPVVVCGEFLADGFHRLEAAVRAGLEEILAEVREGGLREAILFSVGANATHGLPRTQADKRRAVLALLRDPEWSARSDRWIGQQAVVDHKTVARWRADLASGKDFSRSSSAGMAGEPSTGEIPQLPSSAPPEPSGGQPPEPPREPAKRLGRDGRERSRPKAQGGATRATGKKRPASQTVELNQLSESLVKVAKRVRAEDRKWLHKRLTSLIAELRRRAG